MSEGKMRLSLHFFPIGFSAIRSVLSVLTIAIIPPLVGLGLPKRSNDTR